MDKLKAKDRMATDGRGRKQMENRGISEGLIPMLAMKHKYTNNHLGCI